jgi:hypothetical protein
MPDLPATTPVYLGPGETEPRSAVNLLANGTTDRARPRRSAPPPLLPGRTSRPGGAHDIGCVVRTMFTPLRANAWKASSATFGKSSAGGSGWSGGGVTGLIASSRR